MRASLILMILCPLLAIGQLKQGTKVVYLTDSLHYFQIKNDSLLEISINNLWCRYSVSMDTLKLKSNAVFENGNYSFNLQILINNSDSLFLTSFSKNKSDTLKFISVNKRKKSIKNFKFLRIDEYGTWGCKRLILTNDRMLQISAICPVSIPNGPVDEIKSFRLTNLEFSKLMDSLAVGLVLMLPNSKKASHGFDPTYINISFDINGKGVYLEDVGLQKFHWRLYKYLMGELFEKKIQEHRVGNK